MTSTLSIFKITIIWLCIHDILMQKHLVVFLQSAETCYKHNLTELKKEAHKLHIAVTSCIHVKCAAKYFPKECK